jgi:hypothetical protein
MTSLSKPILIAASLGLAACSLYESTGRKSLENNAFAIANGTASFKGCTENSALEDEKLISEDSRAWIYQKDTEPTLLRVVLKNSDLSCRYQFINEQVINTHLEAVVEDTLVRQPSL